MVYGSQKKAIKKTSTVLRIKISEGQQYHYFDVGDVNFRQASPLLNVYVGLQ